MLEALAGSGFEERALVGFLEPLVEFGEFAREGFGEGAGDASWGEVSELGALGEAGFD